MEHDRLALELVETGLVKEDQLDKIAEYQKSLGGSVAQIVVKLGMVSDAQITKFLASKYNLPVVDVSSMVLPIDLLRSVPWRLIKKHLVLPIGRHGNTLTVAICDPTDYEVIEELQYTTGKQIELQLASRAHIIKAITEYRNELEKEKQERISAGKLRPASQGAIQALQGQPTGADSEGGMVDALRTASDGKLTAQAMNKGEVREALIPLLIRKNIITRAELFDAVLDLLLRKGVVDAKGLSEIQQQLSKKP